MMLQPNADLDLLRYIIDLIEEERQQNAIRDCRLQALEQKYHCLVRNQEEFREEVAALSAESRIVNRTQAERIAELESLPHPYSLNGEPICNFTN